MGPTRLVLLLLPALISTVLIWSVAIRTGNFLVIGLWPALFCLLLMAEDIAVPSDQRRESVGGEIFSLLPFWMSLLIGVFFLLVSSLPR